MTHCVFLPRSRRAPARASIEPRASPSGRTWVVRRNRSACATRETNGCQFIPIRPVSLCSSRAGSYIMALHSWQHEELSKAMQQIHDFYIAQGAVVTGDVVLGPGV